MEEEGEEGKEGDEEGRESDDTDTDTEKSDDSGERFMETDSITGKRKQMEPSSIGAGYDIRKSKKSKGKKGSDPPILDQEIHDIGKSDRHQFFWSKELREVMNQGLCRTCWTIASTRSLSARLQIENKADPPLLLSALHLLVGLYNETSNRGGLSNLAHLQEFLKTDGTLLEEDCKCKEPILDLKGNSKRKTKAPVLCTHKAEAKRKFKVHDLIILDKVNEEELFSLVDKGPVAVIIEVGPSFEKFKGPEIYKGTKQDVKNVDKHMLLLCGYGTYENEHYWWCQNSAGVGWGENGFIKLARKISLEKGKPSLIKSIIYPVLLDREAYV